MPRSQLDVVLRVRIGFTPLKRGVRVPRWKSAYLFLSFFLFTFFSFLFFSLVPVPTTTLHGPFRVLNISGASTTKPCSQHGSPSLKKKKRKEKKRKKKKEHEHRAVARDSFGFLSFCFSRSRSNWCVCFSPDFYTHSFLLRFIPSFAPSPLLPIVGRFVGPFRGYRIDGGGGGPRLFEYTRYAKCAKWRTRVLHLLKAISAKPPTKPFLLCHGSLFLSLSLSLAFDLNATFLILFWDRWGKGY